MASAVFSVVLAVALAVPATQGTSFYDLPAPHTIQQVQVVTRNGVSAPDKVFTDDYGNETQLWQHGPGQLLDEGLRQHDNLGRWLRRRYGAILDPFPNASQIWAVSKPSDNMIESALANLAAIFFLENNSDRYRQDLPFAPVPLRTSELMSVNKYFCSNLQYQSDQVQKSVPYTAFLKATQNLMNNLTRNLDSPFSNLDQIEEAYNIFEFVIAVNKTLPVWATQLIPAMKNVSDFLFSHVYFGTNELLRLRAGRLQNTILKNMRLKSSSGGLGPSLALFSGDDETVAAQLKTLGIDALTQPPYAAALVYELHRRENGTYFVKVFYHTDESMTSDPAFISNILCPPTGECDLEEWFSFAHTWAVPDEDFPDVCVSKPERILRTVIMWFWDLLPMTCLCAVFLLTVFYRVSEFRCGKYAQMEE